MDNGNGRTRRRYSDDDRANALAALAANGGNVAKTARELGVPAKTVEQWSKGQRHFEAAQMSETKRGPLADRLDEIAWKLADAIYGRSEAELKAAPLTQVATSLGITIDKARLLRGEPTNIDERRDDARLAALRRHYADAGVGVPGDDGGQPVHPAPADGAADAVPDA